MNLSQPPNTTKQRAPLTLFYDIQTSVVVEQIAPVNSLSLDSLTMLFTSFTTTLCRSWPSRIIIADPGTGVTG
jgi:hypothetical protein